MHYSCNGGDAAFCQSTQTGRNLGKPLWDSENGSQDMTGGAPALIRAIVRGCTDAKFTSFFNWPLIASIYPNLPFNTVGLATAPSPWSGNYTIGANTSSDYSTILETTTSGSPQTADFTVKGGLSTGAVHVWATKVNAPGDATSFIHTQDITPANGSYSLTMQPGYVHTVSTLNTAGKGTAAAPAAHPLTLPYSDNFDGDASGTEAKYLSDMQGSFEVQPCTGRGGQCVQQMAPVKPIE